VNKFRGRAGQPRGKENVIGGDVISTKGGAEVHHKRCEMHKNGGKRKVLSRVQGAFGGYGGMRKDSNL